MLNHLDLTNVGPAASMRLDFGPRLNLLTGNNSLGKTFVLDVAWWALTQTWPGKDERQSMAWPLNGKRREASITYSFDSKSGRDMAHSSKFDSEREVWPLKQARPANPGLVLYLRIDGGYSLWDPARNYWKKRSARNFEDPDRPKSFDFDMNDIWNGLRGDGNVYCEGLLSDWKTWRDRGQLEYQLLHDVLSKLTPHQSDWMKLGEMTRISLSDVREIPTLETPYGPVPVTLASAGVKRILALAYLITWAHLEHVNACKLLGDNPTHRFTVLIDEVELHLHPQWQRVLLPAVLRVMKGLGTEGAIRAGEELPSVQVIASTHAPLVMASIEPEYSEHSDKVFHFDVRDGDIRVDEMQWAPQGDAVGWLVSEVFGLEQARSKDAEIAIEAAEAYMRGSVEEPQPKFTNRESIQKELLRVLPTHDPFWPRWIVSNGDRGNDQV
ncbi:MAG: ATP-binding protein [Candidatus Hydrogenedentes bacterium]|nr:ATP-binding protein [Candidatus Hydrogenedentota bacterium]